MAAFQANRAPGGDVRPSNVTAVFSDDGGHTWTQAQTRVTAPVPSAQCYGAVEPTAAQAPNGSLLVYFRTQTGRLWQTRSDDSGETMLPAWASPFVSSDSPPWLLRLRHISWGDQAPLLMVWTNCGTSFALACANPRNAVYATRNLLHAALSLDGGATWRGFLEVYRDPLMATPAPAHGDIGVAYSYGMEDPSTGLVVFKTGQGVGRWGLVQLDPHWLATVTGRYTDFTNQAAQRSWNNTADFGPDSAYVTSCLFYRHFGPDGPHPAPSCAGGGSGVSLRRMATSAGLFGLCLSMRPPATQAAVLWNFPACAHGRLVMHVILEAPGPSMVIELADHSVPSFDSVDAGLFTWHLDASGLPVSTALTVELNWSVSARACNFTVGSASGTLRHGSLPLQRPVLTPPSYLRLRSVNAPAFCATSLAQVDHGTQPRARAQR